MKLLSERSQSEKALIYYFNYITFWIRQNYGPSKMISGYQWLDNREEGGMNHWYTSEIILCHIPMNR